MEVKERKEGRREERLEGEKQREEKEMRRLIHAHHLPKLSNRQPC